jgi:hypothetical protein
MTTGGAGLDRLLLTVAGVLVRNLRYRSTD